MDVVGGYIVYQKGSVIFGYGETVREALNMCNYGAPLWARLAENEVRRGYGADSYGGWYWSPATHAVINKLAGGCFDIVWFHRNGIACIEST